MNVESAKYSGVLERREIVDPQNFERMVRLVGDHDPHWICRHVRDTRYSMGVRLEVAGKLRGSNANQLLREILGG